MVGDIFQPTHLLFVLVVALLVLGPKRLPEVAKTLGKGIRDFRGAISGDSDNPNPMSSYLSADSSPHHDEAPVPTPTGQTPAPVSETPTPPPAAPAPTPADAGSPPPAPATETVATDIQPTGTAAVGAPATPTPAATPATTAPVPATSSEPAPAEPAPAEDAATQVHPAASSAERHE